MSLCLTPRVEALSQELTGRKESLFAADLASHQAALQAAITGKRILMVGAAGSIGSSTLMAILPYQPAHITVMDTSENNLAELVRSVRSRPEAYEGTFAIEPLDYGSKLAARYLEEADPFDWVLSFAALKHVRSERDVFSLLRMLEVNLLKADRFLGALRRFGHGQQGVFFVSTDKAADPVNLMGASKRAMESLLWAHAAADAPQCLVSGGQAKPLPHVTTTRFANVAFSDGSLPWGFLQRLAKGQALAAPKGIRRFFVSPIEAGELCLLAAFICPHHHVLIPIMDPEEDAHRFDTLAEITLQDEGLSPEFFEDEAQAKQAAPNAAQKGTYPVLLTPADTSGEKPMEHFVGDGEKTRDLDCESILAVAGDGQRFEALTQLLQAIDRACDPNHEAQPSFDTMIEALQKAVPALIHQRTDKSLDDRM